MAALLAVGAIVSIPIPALSPVPVSLQTLFVMLAGFVLGPRNGALAVLLYLAAGALGLPVFAGGKSGLAAFFGPTGGFLIGFIPSAICCGLARSTPVKRFAVLLAVCALSTAISLIFGTVHLSLSLDISLLRALQIGVVPFLPGAVLKCFCAASVYRFLAYRRLLPE